jgi:hypothetical protein
MSHILIPLMIGGLGLWMVACAKRAKVADSARALASVFLAGVVLVFGFTVGPRIIGFVTGPATTGSTPTPSGAPNPEEATRALVGMVLPVAEVVVVLFVGLMLVMFLGGDVWPRVEKAVARREARRAFVHLHTGPFVEPSSERLVARWGPRPETMTRCVECGRNEWPACQCALMREGFPMTSEPPGTRGTSRPVRSAALGDGGWPPDRTAQPRRHPGQAGQGTGVGGRPHAASPGHRARGA